MTTRVPEPITVILQGHSLADEFVFSFLNRCALHSTSYQLLLGCGQS
uniref:Uncharacterized protein n=1 Tax=Rhizophora mucronata TaxID=61149 RepID=A0A2P2N2X4_RHIMU